ncbi:glycosyltransferase family 2 protein [uncultured Prevotella sp.]|uniref:glycosyltransferase family 2 protein n=1 Tax=uncultured Prevotella sp. TaxID=159272 RepID=UPI0027E22BE6|nr:glycosyltransferase family 2 protein [uncultured Prevotella sp.]
MIRFSILTCTYNAGSVLQRTLDSILNQTWVQIEHIIVDGASKDNTMALVNAYRQRNTEEDTQHDIVVSSEPDRGLYDAMNKALKKATGDYVVFLNAGDVLPNEKTLEDISNDVNERSDGLLPAVLYGNTNIVDNNGNLLRPRRLSPPENLNWRSFRHGMLVCHQAFYVRTDIAKAEPYDLRYRFSADVDWCIRVMKHADKEGLPLLQIPEVVINYLDGGMTNKNHRASLIERFRVMRRHYGPITTIGMHIWFVIRAMLKK